jgi:hypothetical protein
VADWEKLSWRKLGEFIEGAHDKNQLHKERIFSFICFAEGETQKNCKTHTAHRETKRAPETMPKGVPAPGPWDLPGDNVNLDNEGLGEGMHPFIRMGAIVRARRMDLRISMDAHDLHNRGFVDKQTFQRALAYAFGNQWNELSLTTAEFDEVRIILLSFPRCP